MESAYRPEHAEKVIEVARNELELLLKQRATINKKVKQVKRTVEGLTVLFGIESANTALARGDGPPREAIDATRKTPTTLEEKESSEALDQLASGSTLYEEDDSALELSPRNNSAKPKLERACRIALLESEEAATAAEVYDRIIRRGSYQLNRCKHPLAQVITALDELRHRGEVQALIKGDCRHWLWNMEKEDSQGDLIVLAAEEHPGSA
jgi:hypothetical protein